MIATHVLVERASTIRAVHERLPSHLGLPGLDRLIVLDAADLLRVLMRNGAPEPARFELSVGAIVRRCARQHGGRLRISGFPGSQVPRFTGSRFAVSEPLNL